MPYILSILCYAQLPIALHMNDFEDADDVQEKWDEFIRIYNTAVEKPRGERCRRGKEQFNTKCKKARNCKLNGWNRWKKRKTENRWKEYIDARNKYVEIIRMERKYNERDIIEK